MRWDTIALAPPKGSNVILANPQARPDNIEAGEGVGSNANGVSQSVGSGTDWNEQIL